ncbi:uncharacterized protein TNCV_3252321 [Trichonephila clavipes]|nr:uncharacterized protein TNCV_3252321 [Trichonephila clavipes]
MGLRIDTFHCEPSPFPESWYIFLVRWHQIGGTPITASSFLPSPDDVKPHKEFNFAQRTQDKQALKGYFTYHIIKLHGNCRYLAPHTWAGVEPTNFGVQGRPKLSAPPSRGISAAPLHVPECIVVTNSCGKFQPNGEPKQSPTFYLIVFISAISCVMSQRGSCGSPVVKVSDHGRHVTSSSPVPLKTRRVGQRCTLNLSRAETSSRWCGVVVRRGGVISGAVHVTWPWFKMTWSVTHSPRVAE